MSSKKIRIYILIYLEKNIYIIEIKYFYFLVEFNMINVYENIFFSKYIINLKYYIQ